MEMDTQGGVEEVMMFCQSMGQMAQFESKKPKMNDFQTELFYIFNELSRERRPDCVITRKEVMQYCKDMPTPLPSDLMYDLVSQADLHYLKVKSDMLKQEMERRKNG